MPILYLPGIAGVSAHCHQILIDEIECFRLFKYSPLWAYALSCPCVVYHVICYRNNRCLLFSFFFFLLRSVAEDKRFITISNLVKKGMWFLHYQLHFVVVFTSWNQNHLYLRKRQFIFQLFCSAEKSPSYHTWTSFSSNRWFDMILQAFYHSKVPSIDSLYLLLIKPTTPRT